MLESKFRDATRSADDWQRRAELAVRAGNDELAREALHRKKAFSVRFLPLLPQPYIAVPTNVNP